MWYFVTFLLVEAAFDIAVAEEVPVIVEFLTRDLVDPGEVTLDSLFHLPCRATGGNITYEWKLNGLDVGAVDPIGMVFSIAENGTLTKFVGKGGDGEYQCIASNSRGTTFSRKLKVRVTDMTNFESHSEKTIQVTVGRPATLECPPRELGGFSVQYSWVKEKDGVLHYFNESERRVITPEGNMHIMYVTFEDINTIQSLDGIQCRMSVGGRYENSASISIAWDGQTFNGDISPSFILKPPENTSAIEGYHFNLRCKATGKPAPVITWKKDGKIIVDGENSFKLEKFNRSLSITKVKKTEHEGTYTCDAKSSNGQEIQAFTELIVNVQPYWTPGKELAQKTTVNYGESATLTCAAEGSPPPTFSWHRDDTPFLENDSHVDITDGGTKIHFTDIDKGEDGVYHCVAENDFGDVVSSTWLHVNLDGGWSEFGAWGECSKTCGTDGTQVRTRSCTSPPPAPNGAACPGSERETRACNQRFCYVSTQTGGLLTEEAILLIICVIVAAFLVGILVLCCLLCPFGKRKHKKGKYEVSNGENANKLLNTEV